MKEKIRNAVANVIYLGTHTDFVEAAQEVIKKLGLGERWVEYAHVEFLNKINEAKYKKVPYEERILLLPHCLKNQEVCKAKYGNYGLECELCGACKIDALIRAAKELNYKGVFVAPGGSIIMKIFEEFKPKAVLGVACYKEVLLGIDVSIKHDVAPQAVLLTKAGCVNTDVVVEEVLEKLKLREE